MSDFHQRPEMSRFRFIRILGRGTYGIVYLAQVHSTNEYLAIKVLFQDLEINGLSPLALREVSILKDLDHANIVTLREVVTTPERLYLIFEYLEGDLRTLLSNFTLSESEVKIVAA